MARRIGNLLSAKKKGKRNSSNLSTSAIDDNATFYSREGDKSVALTVSSQKTVKASNRNEKDTPSSKSSGSSGSSKSGGWMGLKRLVEGKSERTHRRGHSKSEDFFKFGKTKSTGVLDPRRDRIQSEDAGGRMGDPNTTHSSARWRNQMDLAIKGRLDGVDCLSLGPASSSTLKRKGNQSGVSLEERSSPGKTRLAFDALRISFVGKDRSRNRSPADLVSDMIQASGGKECPELILEGYVPGGADRWTVRLDNPSDVSNAVRPHGNTSPVRRTRSAEDTDDDTAELTEDGSANMPSHMLWNNIWGRESPPPIPAHMQSGSSEEGEEDVMQLVAACSVPVDLDEDTFIISTADHFRAVHDVIMKPLRSRRYDLASKIFEKMLKGLKDQNNDNQEYLQACTLHNMGMISMIQSNFTDALDQFQKATEIRTRCLPQNHPDVAVSLLRRGEAYLALNQFEKALDSFQSALAMSPTENTTRAKILNNIGVVRYLQENFSAAMKALTAALEIQRGWLEGEVRRESSVYDASVTLGNMGKVFLEMQEYEVAYSVFEESCLLQTTIFSKDHDLLLASLENLALTHAKSHRCNLALPILRSVLRIREAKFGPQHWSSIQSMGLLSFMLIQEAELTEATGLLQKVSEWQDQHLLDPSDPSLQTTKDAQSAIAILTEGV